MNSDFLCFHQIGKFGVFYDLYYIVLLVLSSNMLWDEKEYRVRSRPKWTLNSDFVKPQTPLCLMFVIRSSDKHFFKSMKKWGTFVLVIL